MSVVLDKSLHTLSQREMVEVKKKKFTIKWVGKLTPEKAEKFATVYVQIIKDQERRDGQ
jgi:hypothetical protein